MKRMLNNHFQLDHCMFRMLSGRHDNDHCHSIRLQWKRKQRTEKKNEMEEKAENIILGTDYIENQQNGRGEMKTFHIRVEAFPERIPEEKLYKVFHSNVSP